MAKPPKKDSTGNGGRDAAPPKAGPGPDSARAGAAAAAEADTPETEPETPRRGGASSFLWLSVGVLVVLVGAGAAYLSWPLWNDRLPGYLRLALAPVMDAGRDTGLRQRMDAIEARLGKVETDIAGIRDAVAKSAAAGSEQGAAERARLAERIAALEASGGGTGARLTELASRLDRLQAEAGAPAALAARIDALESRIAALQARPAPATDGDLTAALRAEAAERLARLRLDNQALAAAVAALTRRLAALEARPSAAPSAAATGDGALLLAVGQLRDALRGPGAFTRELASVRALGADDPVVGKAVAALAPHAAAGIASRAELADRFPATARAVARVALAPDGAGWLDQTLARLGRVVTVRRVGGDAGAAPGATGALARAEARLGAGDLAGAADAMKSLDGAARNAAESWLADAGRRLEAERALDDLTAHAIRRIDAGRSRSRGDAAGG